MPVEDYAVRLFKEWGIGQAKQDNGVLVLVAPNEREMRIEVGYGLEGILPDGLAGQIIRDELHPALPRQRLQRRHSQRCASRHRHRREAPGADARRAREIQRHVQCRRAGVDHHSVLRPVRHDRLRHGRHRPANQDRLPAAVRQPLRRHATAAGPGVPDDRRVSHAVAVGDRDGVSRLSIGQSSIVAGCVSR